MCIWRHRRLAPASLAWSRRACCLVGAYVRDINQEPPASFFEGPAPEAARFRILALSDELGFLRGLAELLAPRGFDLVAHDQVDAALAYLETERAAVDVMLIDRKLATGSDGFDLLSQAREIVSDVSLIILTGDLRDSTAATALRLGAFHFITKPIVDLDSVTLTLLRAAHFSRLQRRARSLERRAGLDQQHDEPPIELEDYKNARRRAIEAFDHSYFVALLEQTDGNLSKASRMSGIDRSNLRRALSKADLRFSLPDNGTT